MSRQQESFAAIDWLTQALPAPGDGELWIGDDAATVELGGESLLFATDLVVEGTHFDRRFSALSDVGWKVVAVNASDMAAMGGRPLRCVVGVAGAVGDELTSIYEGLLQAAAHFDCPVVGGDLTDGPVLVLSVAMIGTCDGRPAINRSGARSGDHLFVTGPLGASAAGLRLLRSDVHAGGPLVDAHRRPIARLGEAVAAAQGGATAMIDLSDGLSLDLHRLADASGVGFDLGEVPIAKGATREEALSGGEDYELLFAAPSVTEINAAFAAASLELPLDIGRAVADRSLRSLNGSELQRRGYSHRLS